MSKVLSILTIVVLLVLFTGCSDNENLSVDALKVVKSDVVYLPEGGTGSIVLETTQPFEAVSNASWCVVSVSGTTINLTVSPNMSVTSRNALIVITTDNNRYQVDITQMGDMADSNIAGIHKFSLLGGTAEFEVNTIRDYTVSTKGGEGWLTYTDNKKGKIQVKVAAGSYDLAEPRIGTVTVSIGSVKWTGTFEQLPLAGEYIIKYIRNDATQEGICRLDITDTPNTYDVRYLSGVPITNAKGLPGKALYTDGKLAFPMGSQFLGYMKVDNYGSVPLYMYAYCKSGSIALSDDLQYIAPLVITSENKLELTFGDNGVWTEDGSLTVDGFYYACIANGQIVKNWGALTDVVMIHK